MNYFIDFFLLEFSNHDGKEQYYNQGNNVVEERWSSTNDAKIINKLIRKRKYFINNKFTHQM